MRHSTLSIAGAAMLVGAFFGGRAEADHLAVTVSLDPEVSRFTDRLVLTVTGAYSCNPIMVDPDLGTDFASGFIEVRQASGQAITTGYGYFEPLCDGNLQEFDARVAAGERPWHGGQAHAIVSVYEQDCEPGYVNCHNAFATAEGTVRLGGPNP
jgi:hypothetical protein